jgi:hypothetical protein
LQGVACGIVIAVYLYRCSTTKEVSAMDMETLKAGMLKRPDSFAYFGELDLSVWGFAPIGVHRDSDLITQSNFDTALKELRGVSGKSVQVMHTTHWAVGWYDHVMVRTTAKKTMEKVLEICNRLDNYPVLDEEDLSRREVEQADGAYDNWARYDVARMCEKAGIKRLLDSDGDYDPTEADEETVKSLVAEAILDYDPIQGSYSDESLIRMIAEVFSVTQTLV